MDNTQNTTNNTVKEKFVSESSIFPHPYQRTKDSQYVSGTWPLLGVLVVAFFVLKYFIYLKDEKKHNQ